jgi:DNA-binding beta-propeller fold protein YncE
MEMSKYNNNSNIRLHDYYKISLLITTGFIIITMSLMISCSTVSAFDQAKEYVFVKKWGSKGTADGQFQRPHDLDFDPAEKYLYTLDRDGARVQVFDKNGTFIKKWGSYGTGDGQFIDPEHLAIDSDGYVYVSDRGKNNIQVFKPIDTVPHK